MVKKFLKWIYQKMIKLKIRSKGLSINISGVGEFKTPAEIDITKKNLELIVFELKKQGCNDFVIVSSDGKNIDFSLDNVKIDNQNVKNEAYDLLKKIIQKQDLTQELVGELINQIEEIKREKIYGEVKHKKENKELLKKFVDDEVEDFIPSINIDEIKVKGKSDTLIVKENINYEKAAENLKNIKGKK